MLYLSRCCRGGLSDYSKPFEGFEENSYALQQLEMKTKFISF
jgi:hypothetical protein